VTSLAPGRSVLVVKNVAAFTNRYGSGFNIAGQYAGNLEKWRGTPPVAGRVRRRDSGF